jgi:hypothetical protein
LKKSRSSILDRPSGCTTGDKLQSSGIRCFFSSLKGAGALSLRPILFHTNPLVPFMPKRKPVRFSAAKAVKANAREQVGQPKPARVIDTPPRTGRAAKHKLRLEEILRQED